MKNNQIQKNDLGKIENGILEILRFPDDKKSLLKELTEEIIPKFSVDKNDAELNKKFGDKSMLLMRIFENESHVSLMESFEERYRMLSREMTKTMIKEFNCINEIEKSLAELTVNAYIRVLDNSRRLNNELECRDITPNKNVYIANLSKQLDRAHRQYLSSLMTLQQIKSPKIEMNIKTNTAYISNNQQINVNKDENINPQ